MPLTAPNQGSSAAKSAPNSTDSPLHIYVVTVAFMGHCTLALSCSCVVKKWNKITHKIACWTTVQWRAHSSRSGGSLPHEILYTSTATYNLSRRPKEVQKCILFGLFGIIFSWLYWEAVLHIICYMKKNGAMRLLCLGCHIPRLWSSFCRHRFSHLDCRVIAFMLKWYLNCCVFVCMRHYAAVMGHNCHHLQM